MNSSREDLAAAHEKIAQLEGELHGLKRAFDPPPLANPISEEEHRAGIALKKEPGKNDTSSWVLLAFLVTLIVIGAAYAVMTSH